METLLCFCQPISRFWTLFDIRGWGKRKDLTFSLIKCKVFKSNLVNWNPEEQLNAKYSPINWRNFCTLTIIYRSDIKAEKDILIMNRKKGVKIQKSWLNVVKELCICCFSLRANYISSIIFHSASTIHISSQGSHLKFSFGICF